MTGSTGGETRSTAAYAELYRERNKQLIAYATSVTGSPQAAEDLVAEAHFRVWRRLRAGHEVDDVPAYLTTTVRNLAAGLGRAQRAQQASQVDLLTRLLKQLPVRWATALWYAEVEDLPVEDVGARIGTSASTAAVVLEQARERLREAFLRSQSGTSADEAEANSRLPLILGPALLAGVLGGGGWLVPSISGAGTKAVVATKSAAVARTGSGRHARVKQISPAKGVLASSVAVVGVAAAATAFALGGPGSHHATAAAATVTPVASSAVTSSANTATSSSAGAAASSDGAAMPSAASTSAATLAGAAGTTAGTAAGSPTSQSSQAQALAQALAQTQAQVPTQGAQQAATTSTSSSASSAAPSQTQSTTAASTPSSTSTTPTTTPTTPTATQTSSSPTTSATPSASATTTTSASPTDTATETPTDGATDSPTDASTATVTPSLTSSLTPSLTPTGVAGTDSAVISSTG